MPSLPPGRDWNYSFFTFFPDYRDGPHRNLVLFFLGLGLLPMLLALPILLWPFGLWSSVNSSNENNFTQFSNTTTTTTTSSSPSPFPGNNSNNSSSSSTQPITSHGSYSVFQFLYTTLAFGVISIGQHATVPSMSSGWVVAMYVVSQSAIQGTYWALAWASNGDNNSSAGQWNANRVLGIMIESVIVTLFYFFHIVFFVNNGNDDTENFESITTTNTHQEEIENSNNNNNAHNNNNNVFLLGSYSTTTSTLQLQDDPHEICEDEEEPVQHLGKSSQFLGQAVQASPTSIPPSPSLRPSIVSSGQQQQRQLSNDNGSFVPNTTTSPTNKLRSTRTVLDAAKKQQEDEARNLYHKICHRKYFQAEQNLDQEKRERSQRKFIMPRSGSIAPGATVVAETENNKNNNINNNYNNKHGGLGDEMVVTNVSLATSPRDSHMGSGENKETNHNPNNDSFTSIVLKHARESHESISTRQSALVTTATENNEVEYQQHIDSLMDHDEEHPSGRSSWARRSNNKKSRKFEDEAEEGVYDEALEKFLEDRRRKSMMKKKGPDMNKNNIDEDDNDHDIDDDDDEDDGDDDACDVRCFAQIHSWRTTKWAPFLAILITQAYGLGVYQFCLWFTGTFFSDNNNNNNNNDNDMNSYNQSNISTTTNPGTLSPENFTTTTATMTPLPPHHSFSIKAALESTGDKEIILFVIFSISMEILTAVCSFLSRIADLVKPSKGPSLELMNSIQMSNFYCVFNRSLFQHIGSWRTLIILLMLHLVQHFLVYPLRLTRWYFDFSSKIQEKFLRIPVIGPAIYDESPIDVWRVRLNIDMMTRYVGVESSTIAYIFTLTFLRYGWNSQYYSFFASDLPHDDFVRTVVFLALNVVVEVGGLALVHLYLVDLARPIARICKYNRWYFWAMVFGIGHVVTDVFLVRAVINFP